MVRTSDSWSPRRGVAAAIALAVVASACGGASSTDTVETSAADIVAESAEIATTAPVETAPASPAPAAQADAGNDADTPAATESAPAASAAEPAVETSEAEPADTPEAAEVTPTTAPSAAQADPTAPVPDPTAVTAQVAIQLPSVEVVSLATGQTADLSSFARPGPTLVWFWAPH